MKHLREYRPPAHHSDEDEDDDHDDHEDEDVRGDVNQEMIAAMAGDSIPHHRQHHHHHAPPPPPPPPPFGHAPPAHAVGKEEGGMGGGGGGSDWLAQMQAFMLSPSTLADPVHIGPYFRALEKLIDASKEGLRVRVRTHQYEAPI